MKKALLKFFWIYLLFIIIFMLMKSVFLLVYRSLISPSFADFLAVIRHGFSMDCSVAGYLSVIPGLIITGELISGAGWLRKTLDIYMGIIAGCVALLYCLDLGLYGTWGFRLDMTPVFYMTTSPAAAMASVQWWQWFAGVIGIGAISAGIWLLYRLTAGAIEVVPPETKVKRARICQPAVMLLVTALMIIPIRGGFSVATMNVSRAYFSPNQRLNHAAVNPMFSLLYSATHQYDFDSQYDFMPDHEAAGIVDALLFPQGRLAEPGDSVVTPQILSTSRPDIVLIILESFSSHLMPSLGGADIATGLDSIARGGMLFTGFHAVSFRTDQGIPAILSAFPGLPTTALMRYPAKFDNLPSLPRVLREHGYSASYYYGGDSNFANMNGYLVASGFDPIVSDKDFPVKERLSKWGAPDGPVFDRAYADIVAAGTGDNRKPLFTVIQTSSSHEHFDVPYSDHRFASEPRLNSFAYADSCLTAFVNSLSKLPDWHRTLVVLIPDHYGVWPADLADPVERQRIPMVFTGGALVPKGERIDKISSQTDFAATLLAMLSIPSREFRYSRDILSPSTPPVAVFTRPSYIGIITPTDTVVANPDDPATLPTVAKAYLRDIYSTLGGL